MTMKTNTDERKVPKVHIGSVPIMLRSKYCLLADVPIRDLPLLKECPYDEGM
jgi:DNA-directed RNA polymerase II subunit RPB2